MANETEVVNVVAEPPKKRRGCPPGGWPKKDKPSTEAMPHVEVTRNKLPKNMSPEGLERMANNVMRTTEINEAGERVDVFVYKGDPRELDDWEHDEEISPMHVPKEIKSKYPGMAFRYVSKQKWDKFGKNYHGWQTFTDADYPEGVNRGNDLFLCAMPGERAQRYRDSVAERSNQAIRGSQEASLNLQIGQKLSSEEMERMGIPAGSEAGIVVGTRPITKTQFGNRIITGGGGTRGMSREDAREHVRKEIADRKKHRVYSFAK